MGHERLLDPLGVEPVGTSAEGLPVVVARGEAISLIQEGKEKGKEDYPV